MYIGNYGKYSSRNYGCHTRTVEVNGMRLYYSYQTIVAFSAPGYGLVCSQNAWSVTTGKHLNWIEPDKKARVPYEKFQQLLAEAKEKFNVS